MHLENLKEGMEIKNYKELCSLLGEKVKTGNSKKYQLIDWERHFKYEKNGYKFIITEIYEESKIKIRQNNILPFIEEMELLLIDMLAKRKDNIMIMSKSKLMLELCMVNPNYHKYFTDRESLSQVLDMDIGYIIDFYDTTNSTFKSALDTVTSRLENKRLVKHQRIYMIQYDEIDSNILKYNIDTKQYTPKINTIHREATDDEMKEILRIERSLLEYKYELDSVHELFKQGKVFNYYNDVSKRIKKELGIDKAYKAEKYIFNVDELIKQKIKILKRHQIESLEDSLNLKVMIRINDNSNKRYEKAMYDLLEYNKLNHKKPYRVDNEYVDNINTISSSLIDKNNVDSVKTYSSDDRFLDDMME